MSHFTVLVIGDNPEDQLAPYNENTDVEDYVQDIVTEDEKQRFLNFYTDEKKELSLDIANFDILLF